MSDSDAHYTLSLINHQTGQAIKLELVDLPFPARSYRVRLNGEWARKVPVASKTAVCASCGNGGWRIEQRGVVLFVYAAALGLSSRRYRITSRRR